LTTVVKLLFKVVKPITGHWTGPNRYIIYTLNEQVGVSAL